MLCLSGIGERDLDLARFSAFSVFRPYNMDKYTAFGARIQGKLTYPDKLTTFPSRVLPSSCFTARSASSWVKYSRNLDKNWLYAVQTSIPTGYYPRLRFVLSISQKATVPPARRPKSFSSWSKKLFSCSLQDRSMMPTYLPACLWV